MGLNWKWIALAAALYVLTRPPRSRPPGRPYGGEDVGVNEVAIPVGAFQQHVEALGALGGAELGGP